MTPRAEDGRPFQDRVNDWMLVCFGPEISEDRLERGDRFIEEALELAQTVPDFTAARAHALVSYVFGRDVGERHQEVGGVMVTLAALCNTFGVNITEAAERELARVWTKVDAIRAKQAVKPTGSALPIACAPAEDMYLIRKGGGYYRPDAAGYTTNVAEAGRYTLAEAIRHSHPKGPDGPRDGIDYMLAPPAGPNPSADKGAMTLTEKCELADIKRKWEDLCDRFNADRISAAGVALWATLHVDKLIALAEARAA